MRKYELLELLGKCQEQCAPIKMSIGCIVNGIVSQDYIVIYECPQLVLNELSDKHYHYSMRDGGLWVDTRF